MTPTPQDLRRHKRVSAGRRAVRLLVGGHWHDGRLLDVSGGGAALDIDVGIPVGEPVVLSETDLGLISSTVVRRGRGGPSLAFDMELKRRSVLIDRLTLWHNDALLS